jgi:DNA-binding response OmpR family regulator/curved DNA-binding protein CbpA
MLFRSPVARETPHVLIVDDDRATQRMLSDALTKQGFTVTVERDGEWALKSFEKKSFDAVLLDILLPAINGYEVARKMRSLPKGRKTPIIMISGVYKNALHQKEAVQKHGAFAFIEKPMRLDALYQTLKAALGDRYPRPQREQPPPPPVDEDDEEKTGEFMADPVAREEVTMVNQQLKKASSATSTNSAYQSVKGDFEKRSFAEVLAEIFRWRATGALLLKRDKVKKIVFFKDGVPQSIKSNSLSECLGRVMVDEKMISMTECEESLKRMKSSKRQQGTVLIEMGCISPHNLQYALQTQMQKKLFDIFGWDTGEFQFNPTAEPPPDVINLGMTTAQIIHEGVRRYYDERRLRRWFGNGVEAMYVHPSDQPLYVLQDAGLGEDERALLQAVDGHKTVATLRALALFNLLETDRLLFAMKCAQMIELREKPASGKPKPNIARLAEVGPRPPPLPPQPQPSLGGPPPLPGKLSFPAPPPPGRAKPGAPPPFGAKAPALPMPWPDAKPSQRFKGPPPPPPDDDASHDKPTVRNPPRRGESLIPELSGPMQSPLANGESGQREKLASKMSAMRKMDYFEILGLAKNATREDVKRAYFGLAKEYHPDKQVGSASAEVRTLAQQVYDLISQAHDVLSDPTERARYEKGLKGGAKPQQGDEVGKILAAEGKFQKGEEMMRRRDFAAAHQLFKDAVTLYAEEGEFHAWLGWSQFQLDPNNKGSVAQAEERIERAIVLNPRLDKSYLFLGYINKAEGRPDKAEKLFEKAIQANPDCTEALRELRLLGKARR